MGAKRIVNENHLTEREVVGVINRVNTDSWVANANDGRGAGLSFEGNFNCFTVNLKRSHEADGTVKEIAVRITNPSVPTKSLFYDILGRSNPLFAEVSSAYEKAVLAVRSRESENDPEKLGERNRSLIRGRNRDIGRIRGILRMS